MRLLLIGDVVGKPGRQIVCQTVRKLAAAEHLDLVIVNAENIAGGSASRPRSIAS